MRSRGPGCRAPRTPGERTTRRSSRRPAGPRRPARGSSPPGTRRGGGRPRGSGVRRLGSADPRGGRPAGARSCDPPPPRRASPAGLRRARIRVCRPSRLLDRGYSLPGRRRVSGRARMLSIGAKRPGAGRAASDRGSPRSAQRSERRRGAMRSPLSSPESTRARLPEIPPRETLGVSDPLRSIR